MIFFFALMVSFVRHFSKNTASLPLEIRRYVHKTKSLELQKHCFLVTQKKHFNKQFAIYYNFALKGRNICQFLFVQLSLIIFQNVCSKIFAQYRKFQNFHYQFIPIKGMEFSIMTVKTLQLKKPI